MVLPQPFCDIYKQTGNHPTPWVNLILLWIAELRLVCSGLPISSSVLTWHAKSTEKTPGLEWTGRLHLLPRVSNPELRNISSCEIRPEYEHCSAECEKWSHKSRCKHLQPGNCHVTDCLRKKELSAMEKTLPWQSNSPMGNVYLWNVYNNAYRTGRVHWKRDDQIIYHPV